MLGPVLAGATLDSVGGATVTVPPSDLKVAVVEPLAWLTLNSYAASVSMCSNLIWIEV